MEKPDTISMGSYELPNDSKPNDIHVRRDIEWTVLAAEEDRALLISKNCLDWDFFDGSNSIFEPANPTSWERSYLREMLNGDFFDSAFSGAEKQLISETEVTCGEKTTIDRLFLLSADEVEAYFTELSAAAKLPMVDGLSNPDAPVIWNDNNCWWTRTVCADPSCVVCVDEDGRLDYDGISCDADEMGVRPAMWLKTK